MTSARLTALVVVGIAATQSAGCLSLGTYFGASTLQGPPAVSLEVTPLVDEKTVVLPGRFSLTSHAEARGSFCIGLPWAVSATWDDGTIEEYEVFSSVENPFCLSEVVTLGPGEVAVWTDTLLDTVKDADLEHLQLQVRVYSFRPDSKPRRKRFYVVSTQWASGT